MAYWGKLYKTTKASFSKPSHVAHIIEIPRVIRFHILNTLTNECASLQIDQSSLLCPCECAHVKALKLLTIHLILHCILSILYNNSASEKNMIFRSLKKKEKIQKYLTYLTSSKVVKETLVSFESDYKIDASSFI